MAGVTTPPEGWWGRPTASLDWCEPNYAVVPYFAEFWNTITNLVIVFVGAVGLRWTLKDRHEKYFALMYLLIMANGLGSILFHGTLWFSAQLADELPMVWAAIEWLYVMLELEHDKPRYRSVGYALLVVAVIWTALSYWIHLVYNIAFEVLFVALYAACVILLIKQIKKLRNRTVHILFRTYAVFGIGGVTLWLTDHLVCSFVNSLAERYLLVRLFGSLHGWWHVLMGINVYLGVLTAIYIRHLHLHRPVTLRLWNGLLPFVDTTKGEKQRTS